MRAPTSFFSLARRLKDGAQDNHLPLQRPEDLPRKGYPLHPRGQPAVSVPEQEVQELVQQQATTSQAGLDRRVQEATQEGPGMC